MKYRASNGIMARMLSEAEAREHYDRAQFVSGEFGETFATWPVSEFGGPLSVAVTIYTPVRETPAPETGPWLWWGLELEEEGPKAASGAGKPPGMRGVPEGRRVLVSPRRMIPR